MWSCDLQSEIAYVQQVVSQYKKITEEAFLRK